MRSRNTQRKNQGPSDAAILERAFSLVDEAAHTIVLQRRRLGSKEPEDEVFIFRWWADLQFFIVALRRLRRAAEIASRVPKVASELNIAIMKFDKALPMLSTMRNVGEHIDDYALDSPRRRYKHITRHSLQVGTWDGVTFEWLDERLNVDDALLASKELYSAVRSALKNFSGKENSSET